MNRRTLLLGALAVAALTAHAAGKPPASDNVILTAAKRDLPAGTKVTFDDLIQVSVPKSFATSSLIAEANAEYIVNQQLAVPALKGELLRWTAFETAQATFTPRCLELTGAGKDAAKEIAQSRARLKAAAK